MFYVRIYICVALHVCSPQSAMYLVNLVSVTSPLLPLIPLYVTASARRVGVKKHCAIATDSGQCTRRRYEAAVRVSYVCIRIPS